MRTSCHSTISLSLFPLVRSHSLCPALATAIDGSAVCDSTCVQLVRYVFRVGAEFSEIEKREKIGKKRENGNATCLNHRRCIECRASGTETETEGAKRAKMVCLTTMNIRSDNV